MAVDSPGERSNLSIASILGYDIEMRKWRLGTIGLLFVAMIGVGTTTEGRDAPRLPFPIPTSTLTPSPEPTQETPAPTPTPEPPTDPGLADRASGKPGDEPQPAETADETPKGEEETNPGEVAFTDYQPFDLEEIEAEPMQTKWGNFVSGVRGISRYSLFDGKVKFRIGGKAQFDATAGVNDGKYEEFFAPVESDISVRRFEIFAAGRIREFNFTVAFDFGADWGIGDAWIEGARGGLEVWGHHLGKLRVGWMREPFSLERQTGAYNLGLMERSLPVQTMAPGSNIGAMIHDSGSKERFTWAVGVFSVGQSNDKNASTSLLSLTGRTTYLLKYSDQGRMLFHVGLSVSSRSPTGGDIRYRSRPEARFVDYLVDTGAIDASHVTLIGLEAAAVRGPLWITAEHIQSRVSAQLVEDPTFMGSYIKVGWFLTGESRPYRTNSGIFDRRRPTVKYTKGNPFKKKNGGAWEVVGRLSRIDLTDGLVDGGELTDISAALSWYPNATTRIQLNYVRASPKNRGAANIFLLRLRYQPW